MQSDFHILVDSDAFVGLLNEDDANHQKAKTKLEGIKQQKLNLVTTSFVIAETATVLSHRKGQPLARQFLTLIEEYPRIHITEELQQKAIDIFSDQERRGTSVVDCSNVVVMKKFNIPKIFSFDKIYPKDFKLSLVV